MRDLVVTWDWSFSLGLQVLSTFILAMYIVNLGTNIPIFLLTFGAPLQLLYNDAPLEPTWISSRNIPFFLVTMWYKKITTATSNQHWLKISQQPFGMKFFLMQAWNAEKGFGFANVSWLPLLLLWFLHTICSMLGEISPLVDSWTWNFDKFCETPKERKMMPWFCF